MSQLDNMARKQLATKILTVLNMWDEIGFPGNMWGTLADEDLRKIDLSKLEVSSNKVIRAHCESILKEPFTLQDLFFQLREGMKEGYSLQGVEMTCEGWDTTSRIKLIYNCPVTGPHQITGLDSVIFDPNISLESLVELVKQKLDIYK